MFKVSFLILKLAHAPSTYLQAILNSNLPLTLTSISTMCCPCAPLWKWGTVCVTVSDDHMLNPGIQNRSSSTTSLPP